MTALPDPKSPRSAAVDRLVEASLVELASRVDYTYGELLAAAGRLAAERNPRRDSHWSLGVVTLLALCATVIIMTRIIVGAR